MTKAKSKAAELPPEAYDRIPRSQLTLTDETLWLTRFDDKGAPCATYPVAVADAARAFRGIGRSSTGLLPADVLFWQSGVGHTRIGLWLPPARRVIAWARGKRDLQLPVPLPGLVFAGQGRQYWVWAAKARPAGPKEPLFQAPLPNVNPDGLICSGSVAFPVCAPGTIRAAADLFFASRFNADLSEGRVDGLDGELLTFLRSLAHARAFPAGRLLSARVNMGAVLKDGESDERTAAALERENVYTDPLGVVDDGDDEGPDPEWGSEAADPAGVFYETEAEAAGLQDEELEPA